MQTRILDRHDLARILARRGIDALMDTLISAISSQIQHYDAEAVLSKTRDGFQYHEPAPGLIEWMPVMRSGKTVTVKIVGYHPENPRRKGLPTIVGSIGLFNATNGALTGLIDGSLPTTMRTAAASALASRHLAKPDSSILGIIGAGAQGIAQCHALMREFTIEHIYVSDANPDNQASFARRFAGLGQAKVKIDQAPMSKVISCADILCTATSLGIGQGPLFKETAQTKPWLHINAVGSDFVGKFELPVGLLKRAIVVPDFAEQCFKEGECQQLAPQDVGPDLVNLCNSSADYQEQLTVFDSTGWALEDQIVCEMFLDEATKLGVGRLVDFHYVTEDPLNPYGSA